MGDRDPLDLLVSLGDAKVFLRRLGDPDPLLPTLDELEPTLGRGGVSTICTSSSEPDDETVAECDTSVLSDDDDDDDETLRCLRDFLLLLESLSFSVCRLLRCLRCFFLCDLLLRDFSVERERERPFLCLLDLSRDLFLFLRSLRLFGDLLADLPR